VERRIAVAGAFKTSQVTLSRIRIPGEAVVFSQDLKQARRLGSGG
jgi:hypothetical protein